MPERGPVRRVAGTLRCLVHHARSGSWCDGLSGTWSTNCSAPQRGETLLDAGCGTGVFTVDMLARGARVVGLDISGPMLALAGRKAGGGAFFRGQGRHALPSRSPMASFDKTVSITALEFIADAGTAVDELFRVTRPGGAVVVATLNSLSPWATRRRAKTLSGQRHILEDAHYRSPADLLALAPSPASPKTVVHFRMTTNRRRQRTRTPGTSGDPGHGRLRRREMAKTCPPLARARFQEKAGMHLLAPGLSIRVDAMKGTTAAGELAKCRQFAAAIASALEPQARRQA